MSSKLLKNIDWIIPVPKRDDIVDCVVESTKFSINHNNGDISKWTLKYNFKRWGKTNFTVYLSCDESSIIHSNIVAVHFGFIVLDHFKNTKCKKQEFEEFQCPYILDVLSARYNYIGQNILTHDELFDEECHYIQDGKLHLVVVIKEELRKSSLNDVQSLLDSKHQAQIENVFRSMKLGDTDLVTLRTSDGVELKAFKNIISNGSVVFEKMFETDMVEKAECAVDVIDFSGEVMEELLRFMIIGKIQSIETVDIQLYKAATVYQVEDLQNVCLKSIENRISVNNFLEVLEFAYDHDVSEIFGRCCEFVGRYLIVDIVKQKFNKLNSELKFRVYANLFEMTREREIFCKVENKE